MSFAFNSPQQTPATQGRSAGMRTKPEGWPVGSFETYAEAQADHYRAIVRSKPSQEKYLKGWLRRAAWLP